jgi:23S rRNA (adenine2503-C2)-methyltransferase
MNLYGQTLSQLLLLIHGLGEPAYRARQIAEWLYRHHVSTIDAMTNLPVSLRSMLSSVHEIVHATGREEAASADGTTRQLWDSFGDDAYESALIPETKRLTLCMSSQSGCRIGCRFCLTARMGFRRNLSAAEILSQYEGLPQRDAVTHLVFMGMGEPLDNIDSVLDALTTLTATWGYDISPRRITVSTVGIHPELERLLDATNVNIAISLHTARPEERLPLVPSENRHPIATTVEILRHRAEFAMPPFSGTGRRRVSFEITLMDGVNDSKLHARAVRDLILGIPARVNLIPWNAFPGAPYRPSSRAAIERYQAVLKQSGITTTIRQSRGEDIGAACGLLAGRQQAAR